MRQRDTSGKDDGFGDEVQSRHETNGNLESFVEITLLIILTSASSMQLSVKTNLPNSL